MWDKCRVSEPTVMAVLDHQWKAWNTVTYGNGHYKLRDYRHEGICPPHYEKYEPLCFIGSFSETFEKREAKQK
jgi:hypothetical protein